MTVHINSKEHFEQRRDCKELSMKEESEVITLLNEILQDSKYLYLNSKLELLQRFIYNYENYQHQAIARPKEWFDASKVIPEEGQRVLTFDREYIEICRYEKCWITKNKLGFVNEQDEQPSQVYPSHWQPLPDKPYRQ